MSQAHLSLSCAAAARLTRLLADLAATPGIGPDHRYELAYCREQVREHLPVIEGLVIAGLLLEAPDRLALIGRPGPHASSGPTSSSPP
jgi:hypothetical protein